MKSKFLQSLQKQWAKNRFICIGLDPTVQKLPKDVSSFFKFNKSIIDETHDLVLGYKPNSAFYEALGASGIEELKKTVDYIKKVYPDKIVIFDAKRADIDSTNEGYVKFAFDYLNADAITIHPYLGKQAVLPFLERADKGIIVLTKTSNSGAGEFQDLNVLKQPLYLKVAKNVAKEWNFNGNCGLVVGATYPKELSIVRKAVGDIPILIPGIGAQGGDVKKTIKAGRDSKNQGVIINVSRSVIFASNGPDFAKVARTETERLTNEINQYRLAK